VALLLVPRLEHQGDLVVWWDTECDRASEEKLCDSGGSETYKTYIDFETNLRILCKRKKIEAWRRYNCSSLTYKTRLSEI
jgi:hypothetical protein